LWVDMRALKDLDEDRGSFPKTSPSSRLKGRRRRGREGMGSRKKTPGGRRRPLVP
jgi:hypothetical protein